MVYDDIIRLLRGKKRVHTFLTINLIFQGTVVYRTRNSKNWDSLEIILSVPLNKFQYTMELDLKQDVRLNFHVLNLLKKPQKK